MKKHQFKAIHEYLNATGTSQARLLEQLVEQTGRKISPSLLCAIIRGSRRCSKLNALALSVVTGVPTEYLEQWPRYREHETSRSVA